MTFLTSWRVFDFMTNFSCIVHVMTNFLMLWRTFWRYDVFLTSWRTFWCHDTLLHHDKLFDIKVLTCRGNDNIFCRYDVFFTYFWRHYKTLDIMTSFELHYVRFDRYGVYFWHFWMSYHAVFWTPWRTFWLHDFFLCIFLTSLQTFWYHDVLWTPWQTFWHYGIFFWHFWCHSKLFDFMTCFSGMMCFEVMTNFLTSLRIFEIITNLLTLFRNFDVMTHFWRHDALLDITTNFLT